MRIKLLILLISIFLFSSLVEANHFAYLPNQQNNNLTIIDLDGKKILSEISIGHKIYGIAISPQGDRVYLADSERGTISILDTADNKIVGETYVGKNPKGMVVSPDGKKVYIAVSDDHRLAVLDTEQKSLSGSFATQGFFPWGIALNPQSQRLYISNYGYDNKTGEISVFDISGSTPFFKGKLNLSLRAYGHSRPKGIETYGNQVFVTVFDHAVNKNYRILRLQEDFSDSSQLKPVEIKKTVDDPLNLMVNEDGRKVYTISSTAQTLSIHDTSSLEVLDEMKIGKNIGGISLLGIDRLYLLIPSVLLKLVSEEIIYPDLFSSVYVGENEYFIFGKFIGPELNSEISASPNKLEFPEQLEVTPSSIQKIKLNVKNNSIVLDNFYLSGEEFKFSPFETDCQIGKEIKPGESCTIAINFQPISVGKKESTLTVRSRSGKEWLISLAGIAIKQTTSDLPPSAPAPSTSTKDQALDNSTSGGCSFIQIDPSLRSMTFIYFAFFSLFIFIVKKSIIKNSKFQLRRERENYKKKILL